MRLAEDNIFQNVSTIHIFRTVSTVVTRWHIITHINPSPPRVTGPEPRHLIWSIISCFFCCVFYSSHYWTWHIIIPAFVSCFKLFCLVCVDLYLFARFTDWCPIKHRSPLEGWSSWLLDELPWQGAVRVTRTVWFRRMCECFLSYRSIIPCSLFQNCSLQLHTVSPS